MRWSDVPRNPSSKMLRQFAVLWILFFGAIAYRQYFMRGDAWLGAGLAGLAVVVGTLGLLQPRWIRPIFVGWMILAFPIGWVISHVILGILYYGLFTFVGLIFKLIGRDALSRRRPATVTSYWIEQPPVRPIRSYFRQF
jgi:hypothetical protein